VGLIAHQLESTGIPTMSVSSARDITEAAKTPRSGFLDFPLGHTTGKPGDIDLSYNIISDVLSLFEHKDALSIKDLPYRWSDSDDWKDHVFPAGGPEKIEEQDVVDDRLDRGDKPQYQSTDDAVAASRTHKGMECTICSGVDY
tara:strand:+ start:3704 stop:4132 length:429 start_codon:yes stop_codon:yes gene_type:complete